MKKWFFLFSMAGFLTFGSTKAIAADETADARVVIFNSIFVSEFNSEDGGRFKNENDIRQGWYTDMKALRAANKKQIVLASSGKELCVTRNAGRVCWAPVWSADQKLGIRFSSNDDKSTFYPTNLTDRELSKKEFLKFAQSKKVSFWNLFVPEAMAESLSKNVKVDGMYFKSFEKHFPGIVVASSTGWKFLAKDPSPEAAKEFITNVSRYSSYSYYGIVKDGTVTCRPIKVAENRADGSVTEMTMNKDETFAYNIIKDGKPTHTFLLEMKQANDFYHMSDAPVNKRFSLPRQTINVSICKTGQAKKDPYNKTCPTSYDFGYVPDSPWKISDEEIKALTVFSNFDGQAGKILNKQAQAPKNYNEYHAFFEMQNAHRHHANKLQTQMLHMKEIQTLCENPRLLMMAYDSGLKFDFGGEAPPKGVTPKVPATK